MVISELAACLWKQNCILGSVNLWGGQTKHTLYHNTQASFWILYGSSPQTQGYFNTAVCFFYQNLRKPWKGW